MMEGTRGKAETPRAPQKAPSSRLLPLLAELAKQQLHFLPFQFPVSPPILDISLYLFPLLLFLFLSYFPCFSLVSLLLFFLTY